MIEGWNKKVLLKDKGQEMRNAEFLIHQLFPERTRTKSDKIHAFFRG